MPKKTLKQTSRKAIEGVFARLPVGGAGLPARDSVTAVTTGAGKYTIIHTREMDAYDKGATGPGLAPAAAAAAPAGDNFQGSARKAAKLSIANAPAENFNDLKDVISSLVPDAKMIARKPKISTSPASTRVKEEKRNVHVTAFIYAASKEADNDFHLIVGRDPNNAPEIYLTMELSGLPPASASSFAQLSAARDAFKQFFINNVGGKLPGTTYDFYQPPIPVQIDGSLFFDMSHATGTRPGPPSLKSRMPVIWEVHPITTIVFG